MGGELGRAKVVTCGHVHACKGVGVICVVRSVRSFLL